MSRVASLYLYLTRPVGIGEIMAAIGRYGAHPSSRSGILYFLDDLYDWTDAPVDELSGVLGMLESQAISEPVGIEVNWPDEAGGNLVFHPGRARLSILFSADSRKIHPGSEFVDVGWYLRTLVPALEPYGLYAVETRDGSPE